MKNIHDSDIFTGKSVDLNEIRETNKSLYLYSDLLKLNVDFNNVILKTPLGIEINYNNNKYPFVVNPYEINMSDKFIQEEHAKPSKVQKPVLLTGGNILNNCIYLCKCQDILTFYNNRNISEEYILKLYYLYYLKNK